MLIESPRRCQVGNPRIAAENYAEDRSRTGGTAGPHVDVTLTETGGVQRPYASRSRMDTVYVPGPLRPDCNSQFSRQRFVHAYG